jgi:enterochelin esterase-like enzyme
MSARAVALALALGLVLVGSGGASPPPPRQHLAQGFQQFMEGPDGGQVWQGKILNGQVPGAWRTTVVYVPPQFSPARRYPVVYLLQGVPGAPYQYVYGLALADRADPLIAAGGLRPFIAVMPPAGLTPNFDGEWTGVWEDYVVRNVVPWVDDHLPAIAGGRGRIVAGLSAGGYGAVDIGLRHPAVFGTLEAWSGSFTAPHDGSLRGASRAQLAAHDPSLLLRREAPLVRRLGTRFFLSCGTRDRLTARATIGFARELAALHIAHRVWLGPGGHQGRFWASQLVPALRFALQRPS